MTNVPRNIDAPDNTLDPSREQRRFADSSVPGGLTGNADRDIAFAYVWAMRFVPNAMGSVKLDDYKVGSLPGDAQGYTQPRPFPFRDVIIIDYKRFVSMSDLVGTVVHEADHCNNPDQYDSKHPHVRGDKTYQIGNAAAFMFFNWTRNPQPPNPGLPINK